MQDGSQQMQGDRSDGSGGQLPSRLEASSHLKWCSKNGAAPYDSIVINLNVTSLRRGSATPHYRSGHCQAPLMFTTREDFVLSYHESICMPTPGQEENQTSFLTKIGNNLMSGINVRRRGIAPFASLSSPGIPAVPVLESRTGTEFPLTYCHISKKDCPKLIGVGYAFLHNAISGSPPS